MSDKEKEIKKTNVDERALSTAERLIGDKLSRKEKMTKLIEDHENWKSILNRMAGTGEGEYVLKILFKHADIFSVEDDYNGVMLVKDKAKSEFYRKYVRPYLVPDIRNKIEG